MPCSLIKHLWKGIKSAKRLKLIDLRNSRNLIETPDFSGVPNLQHLILQCCTRLSKIHTSLGDLKQLLQLDLSGCKSLESLPSEISLESLEVFILSGCSRLKKFPEIVGNMSRLSHLYLDGTAIKELPSSVEHLTGLVKLDLSGSAIREWSFPTFPSRNLEILSLSGCEGLSSKSSNKLLSFPLMRRASPNPIGMLVRSFSGLRLQSLPELPSNIDFIQADGCTSLETLPLRQECSFKPRFSLLNCFKLVENQGCSEMFKKMELHPFDQLSRSERRLVCYLKVKGSDYFHSISNGFPEEFGKIGSHHLWLRYSPRFFNPSKEKLSQNDENGSIPIEIKFRTEGPPGLVLKKCGACLVYKHDIENMNQSVVGSSNVSITPEEDDFDDSIKDTKIKRNRDESDELIIFSSDFFCFAYSWLGI
nr:protein suppressor of npr1-1, constitutive 1 [Quercus suber]